MKQILLLLIAVVMVGCGEVPEGVTKPKYNKTNETEQSKSDWLETLLPLANKGDADAQNKLGVKYNWGNGVTQNDSQAIKWYLKAAERGHTEAQYNLGWMFDRGSKNTPEDLDEALKWYHKAAEGGYVKAQNMLGATYSGFLRIGFPKDFEKSVKWFRKAAEQGNAEAQFNLAGMYDDGEGVEEDDVVAYAWFKIASASGTKGPRMPKLIKVMEPDQIAQAEALAKEMIKKNPKLLNKQ